MHAQRYGLNAMDRLLPSPLRYLLLALLCCLPSTLAASGNLFDFTASQGNFHFSLEMTGRDLRECD